MRRDNCRVVCRVRQRATRYATKHFFHARISPLVLSRRTFSLRERDMRQAGYWTHSYHSDATTMSETDGERRRVMRGSFLEVWEGGGFFNSRACLDVDFF
jgi:hypothetical protein